MSAKHTQKVLDHAKQSATDAYKIKIIFKYEGSHYKTTSTIQSNSKSSRNDWWFDCEQNCWKTKLQKSQEIHNKIIQRQLQIRMIKKYLKKDIYLQKKTSNYFRLI